MRPAPAQLTVPGGEPRARERLRGSALLSAHAPRSRRRAEEMGAAEADRTLFVGNLDPRVTEELVFELFHQVGDGARRPGRVSPPPPRPAAELGRGGRGRFIGGLPRARQHPCEVGRLAGCLAEEERPACGFPRLGGGRECFNDCPLVSKAAEGLQGIQPGVSSQGGVRGFKVAALRREGRGEANAARAPRGKEPSKDEGKSGGSLSGESLPPPRMIAFLRLPEPSRLLIIIQMIKCISCPELVNRWHINLIIIRLRAPSPRSGERPDTSGGKLTPPPVVLGLGLPHSGLG